MRKLLLALMLTAMLAASVTVHASVGTIGVFVNGRRVDFSGQGPVIVNGRVLVPVRDVFETLGFDVDWNQERQQITLVGDNDEIIISIGSEAFSVNSIRHEIDVPAR